MKNFNKLLLVCLCFTNSIFLFAQKRNKEIEINPYVRFDKFPQFSYNYGGRYTTDFLKMTGNSYGLHLSYKYGLKKHFFLKAGLGYLKYKFDNLNNTNSLTGKSHARPIDFVSPLLIGYSTNKYHYNNIMMSTGIDKEFALNKGFKISASFDLTAYYTYSQYYHLTFKTFDGNQNFNKNNATLFGFSGTISTGITKQLNNLQIGPAIILPIFDSWRNDTVFLEDDKKGKNKWLNGVGVGIVCNILLHTKK